MVHYSPATPSAFPALSDPIRRAILTRLGQSDATISDLASAFHMSLTGARKHVQILESAGLVTSVKAGRVRTCHLGPRTLDAEAEWIESYRQMVENRLNRLGDFLEDTKEKP